MECKSYKGKNQMGTTRDTGKVVMNESCWVECEDYAENWAPLKDAFRRMYATCFSGTIITLIQALVRMAGKTNLSFLNLI